MKYNADGAWKPLVYRGNSDPLQVEARRLSADLRIQGVLFYILCTGHKVIEFAIRASVRLPTDKVDLPNDIHFFHVPQEADNLPQNQFVYDAWAPLSDEKTETISRRLLEINRTMNLLGFAYSCETRWQLKYTLVNSSHGAAQPNEDDLALLAKLVSAEHEPDAQSVLDAAIDWYRRGRASDNAFNRFLCSWIAMEGLALSLYDGCLGDKCPYGFAPKPKELQEAEERKCIEEYRTKFLEKDPVRFIREAYSECIRGIRRRTLACFDKVFGAESSATKTICGKADGVSLEDIRHRIAHGEYSGWDFKDEDIVLRHVGRLESVAREFLLRVLLRLRPWDEVPSWSGMHQVSALMADPRSTLVVSDLQIVGDHDWTIKAGWID